MTKTFSTNAYVGSFKPEKVCKLGLPVVLVWELWKGRNGRGAYRIEIELCPELARPIEKIHRSDYLYEDSFGVVSQEHKKI